MSPVYEPKETTDNKPATGWVETSEEISRSPVSETQEPPKKLQFNWWAFAVLVFTIGVALIVGYFIPFLLEAFLIVLITIIYGLYTKTGFSFRKFLWK